MTDDIDILIVGGTRRRWRQKAGEVVRLRITTDQKDGLREVAKFEKRTMSDVIRDAVDSYVGDFSERVIFTPSGDTFKIPTE